MIFFFQIAKPQRIKNNPFSYSADFIWKLSVRRSGMNTTWSAPQVFRFQVVDQANMSYFLAFLWTVLCGRLGMKPDPRQVIVYPAKHAVASKERSWNGSGPGITYLLVRTLFWTSNKQSMNDKKCDYDIFMRDPLASITFALGFSAAILLAERAEKLIRSFLFCLDCSVYFVVIVFKQLHCYVISVMVNRRTLSFLTNGAKSSPKYILSFREIQKNNTRNGYVFRFHITFNPITVFCGTAEFHYIQN